MWKLGVSMLLVCCGAAYANSPTASIPSASKGLGWSLSTPLFVTVNGEYRVCHGNRHAKTRVINGICVWESELSADELQHPKAVAGLVMRRASTLSVSEFVETQVGDGAFVVGAMREEAGELVVDYQPGPAIFVSSQ